MQRSSSGAEPTHSHPPNSLSPVDSTATDPSTVRCCLRRGGFAQVRTRYGGEEENEALILEIYSSSGEMVNSVPISALENCSQTTPSMKELSNGSLAIVYAALREGIPIILTNCYSGEGELIQGEHVISPLETLNHLKLALSVQSADGYLVQWLSQGRILAEQLPLPIDASMESIDGAPSPIPSNTKVTKDKNGEQGVSTESSSSSKPYNPLQLFHKASMNRAEFEQYQREYSGASKPYPSHCQTLADGKQAKVFLNRSGMQTTVHIQLSDPTGKSPSHTFPVETSNHNGCSSPSLTLLSDGSFLVSFLLSSIAGVEQQEYAVQRFSPSGASLNIEEEQREHRLSLPSGTKEGVEVHPLSNGFIIATPCDKSLFSWGQKELSIQHFAFSNCNNKLAQKEAEDHSDVSTTKETETCSSKYVGAEPLLRILRTHGPTRKVAEEVEEILARLQEEFGQVDESDVDLVAEALDELLYCREAVFPFLFNAFKKLPHTIRFIHSIDQSLAILQRLWTPKITPEEEEEDAEFQHSFETMIYPTARPRDGTLKGRLDQENFNTPLTQEVNKESTAPLPISPNATAERKGMTKSPNRTPLSPRIQYKI